MGLLESFYIVFSFSVFFYKKLCKWCLSSFKIFRSEKDLIKNKYKFLNSIKQKVQDLNKNLLKVQWPAEYLNLYNIHDRLAYIDYFLKNDRDICSYTFFIIFFMWWTKILLKIIKLSRSHFLLYDFFLMT